MIWRRGIAVAVLAIAVRAVAAIDETPAKEGEWGFRPTVGEAVAVNPPRFSWRPQGGITVRYAVEASRDREFKRVDYSAKNLEFNVHAPPQVFEAGEWYWRFGVQGADGKIAEWSSVRTFTVPADAVAMPIPAREELLKRVPTSHPRLFVRPEWMGKLRERAKTDLKPEYDRLIAQCDKWLKNPPKVEEPKTYPPGVQVKSEEWREYWTHGMRDTPTMLEPMVNLGLAYHLSGDQKYGEAGKRILLTAVKWDPKGATGYRYNDEAGMPYNYLFARGYTYLYDLLTPEERAECRRVMRIRGKEMYDHLRPTHLWQPYESHRNRAWHFLGEVAIAFHGEIPEADDWLWFAVNVFANTYPVWNDTDGGWHEGLAYWRSYMNRFSWWADAMRAAVDIDAYKLPYFSKLGYYAMYLQPPGTQWGGFGDQNTNLDSSGSASLMQTFAAQARNPYWEWYARMVNPANAKLESAPDIKSSPPASPNPPGYFGFIRAASYPSVEPKPPTDLPTSRVFRGIGQAFMNATLLDAKQNVEVLFKSSPMATQSHGYNAQNSFELYAFGKPIFLSTGQRDIYGSDHHANWMWETKSCNNILVDGKGQVKHSRLGGGKIGGFYTSDKLDWVCGEVGDSSYPDGMVKKWTRDVVFAKPGMIVIYDRIEMDRPRAVTWMLHSNEEMKVDGGTIRATNGIGEAEVKLLSPGEVTITETDQFDVPPRERIRLKQWHLKAEMTAQGNVRDIVAVIRLKKAGETKGGAEMVKRVGDGMEITALGSEGGLVVRTHGTEAIEARLEDGDGKVTAKLPAE